MFYFSKLNTSDMYYTGHGTIIFTQEFSVRQISSWNRNIYLIKIKTHIKLSLWKGRFVLHCIYSLKLKLYTLGVYSFVLGYKKAPWYSGHGLRLLHRRSRFDSRSRRFTWQVNEPLPGSTHALWGELVSQSKVLTGHWLTKCL